MVCQGFHHVGKEINCHAGFNDQTSTLSKPTAFTQGAKANYLGQVDTVWCDKLVNEIHIYICLGKQPRWTTVPGEQAAGNL